jgi:predicted metal-dependent enzyme (double-stranded beta helix superfamily)
MNMGRPFGVDGGEKEKAPWTVRSRALWCSDSLANLDQAERDLVESFRAIVFKAVEWVSALVDSPNQTVALRAIEMVMSRTDLTVVWPVSTSPASFSSVIRRNHRSAGILAILQGVGRRAPASIDLASWQTSPPTDQRISRHR